MKLFRLNDATSDRKSELLKEKGFTLVEILIALAIMSIVTMAIYELYISQYKTWVSQDLITEMQQNARVTIDTMTRDILMAGYGVSTPIDTGPTGVEGSNGTRIAVRYRDPGEAQTSPNLYRRIMFWRDATDNVLYRKVDASNSEGTLPGISWDPAGAQPLSDNVTGMSVSYFDSSGAALDVVADPANAGSAYRIKVSVTVQTSKNDPITRQRKSFTLSTDIRPRNIGITGVAADIRPPAVPTGLQVIDPGRCGTLRLRWNPNTDVDLAGYTVYYGLCSRDDATCPGYSGRINVPISAASSYDLTGLTTTQTGGSPTTYYIAVAAYDTSGNISGYSDEVGGQNPVSSIRALGAGNDTTINVDMPTPPTNFRGADGPANNQVMLTWTASTDPNVKGYRLYRRTLPFTTFPVVPDAATILVASEGVLTSATTSFTDTSPGLLGCTVYYYALAPVTCDTGQISNYTSSDYAITFGDGTGAAADSPAGSDTAPGDNVAPNTPAIGTRAGWKRVAVSVTQSSSPDTSRMCVYVRVGSSFPELRTDTVTYPLVNGCYQVANGQLIPDSGGVFDTTELPVNQSTSFWHDSMTDENPAEPSLAETGTYSYRAVSFDRCGNASNITGAQATTTLCGEDPEGKPPAVTNAAAAVCSSPVALAWTGVSSDTSFPSSPTNPYDLAGYRVFKGMSEEDWSSASLISGAAPFWGTTYSDTAVSDGGIYYYRIVSTDCPYERTNPSEGTIRTAMNAGTLNYTQVGPVKPGMIDRDDQSGGHPEVLTLDSTGDPSTNPGKGYHNAVKVYSRNTSQGTMTITGISDMQWGNTAARLAKVTIGGAEFSGTTTTETVVWQAASEGELLGVCSGALCTASVTFGTPKQIEPSDLHVPFVFEFRYVNNSVNEFADMRDDSSFKVKLDVRNDSTNTTGCFTFLTESQENVPIPVPRGPEISGTVQNRTATDLPASSTSPGYWIVGAGLNVNVVTNVADTSGAGISLVKLYYAITDKTAASAPSSGYTEIPMTLISGIQYRTSTPIPANEGKRVWYYIVAKDARGNFDRDPEIQTGFYTYDHLAADPCTVTPNNPTSLLGTPDPVGNTVALSWTEPTKYTNGDNRYSNDEFKYKVYRRDSFAGAWNQVAEVSSANYTDSGLNLSANNYSYYVRTINKCSITTPVCVGYSPWPASPPSCLSTESNTYTECVGGGAISVNPSKGSILAGENFGLTAFVCDLATGIYSTTIDEIQVHNRTASGYDDDIFWMRETGAETGEFGIKDSLYGGQTNITTSGTGFCNPADVCLYVRPTGDTITFDDVIYGGSPHPGTYATVNVLHNPCSDTPASPTGLTRQTMPNCASDRSIVLQWNANSETDVIGYDVYQITPSGIASPVCSTNSRTVTSCTANTSDGQKLNSKVYQWIVKAKDSCATPNVSAASATYSDPCP